MTETKQIIFVLFTAVLTSVALASLNIGGITIKQAPILLASSIFGLLIYLKERTESLVAWSIASALGFAVMLFLYKGTISQNTLFLSLLVSIMIILPPLLIRLRQKILSMKGVAHV